MAQLPTDPAVYGDASRPVRFDPWHVLKEVHWADDKPPPINPDGGICLHEFGAFYLFANTRLVIDTAKTPVADSAQGIYSIWFRQIAKNPGIPEIAYNELFGRMELMHAESADLTGLFGGWLGGSDFFGAATGPLNLTVVDGDGILATEMRTDFLTTEIDQDDGKWHHIFCSWESPDSMVCFIDGVERSGPAFPGNGSTILYGLGVSAFDGLQSGDPGNAATIRKTFIPRGSPEVAILGTDWLNGTSGMFAELYFAPGQFSADVTKFRTADGKPADLGADGSIPTGIKPLVYGCANTLVYLRGRHLRIPPVMTQLGSIDAARTTITITGYGDVIFFDGHYPPPLDPWFPDPPPS
jgi:hypothetical protein